MASAANRQTINTMIGSGFAAASKTFIFLPPVSPTDGHYSFIARSHALQLPEGRSWADNAPGQGARTCCTIAAPQVLDGAGIVPQCSQGPSFNHALAADPGMGKFPSFQQTFSES